MTLPAQSLPDAAPADQVPPNAPKERELPFPLPLVAVVGVSALVVILCVLGAVGTGLFRPSDATEAAPAATEDFVAPEPGPPADSFDDGQWLIGVDVAIGTYETTVPDASGGCTWERASSADGTVKSVISTGTAKAGERLEIELDTVEHVVRSTGCGVWHRIA